MGWPVVRGVMTLGHAMTSFRALNFANAALEELTDTPGNGDHDHSEPVKKFEITGWMAGLNMASPSPSHLHVQYLPLLATTE